MTDTRPSRTRTIQVDVSDDVRAAIETVAASTGRELSAVASEMLAEAARMRRHPGIVFVDGPNGRRAQIAGTDIPVHQIIGTYNDAGERWERVRAVYGSLTEEQLRAARAYADAFPEEIAAELDAEDLAALERVWAEYPATRPSWR